MFKSGMTDLAPHQHLLFSARFPIQKGKMAGVCHQLAGGGEDMGVKDVLQGVRTSRFRLTCDQASLLFLSGRERNA